MLHALGALLERPAVGRTSDAVDAGPRQDYYCYAPDGGLFEPLIELGAGVDAGTPAGLIHARHTVARARHRPLSRAAVP